MEATGVTEVTEVAKSVKDGGNDPKSVFYRFCVITSRFYRFGYLRHAPLPPGFYTYPTINQTDFLPGESGSES